AEQLIHNQELVAAFASLAGDWESRNTEGVNPARPYLEAIESINSLDAMTAYLLDDSGMNFTQKFLVDIRVK
ncbi:hypothetical protein, partial [Eubacterium aggregans]|uniref:hypothetical protein n=1 Tax=Eubacterium aggregans TaxID=81409 RepID=UPI003F3701C8